VDYLVNAVLVVLLAVGPAALAAGGVVLIARRSIVAIGGGLVLLAVAALVPLLFAYAIAIGIAGAVVGGTAAAIWQGRRIGWVHRTFVAASVVALVAVPMLVIEANRIQGAESYDRCAGDKAIAAIEQSRAAGKGYPSDMHEVALQDGEYGDSCYVSNGVNWLYRVGVPGTYTLGYWVDWRLARHVCRHVAGTRGWSCGFESWGPFRPGETD
jgi:hypothetical protein